MLNLLKSEANKTYTENGAVAYRSTTSDCLDLFATIGALRGANDSVIIDRFLRAYAEDADLAMKLLFYARDIRGGIGERRVFRVILRWLADNEPLSVEKNIRYIAEFGRYDDLLSLMDTACEKQAMQFIKQQLSSDCMALKSGQPVSLLAKWLPSINASHNDTIRYGKRIARFMGMNDAQYRKILTALRAKIHIIENNLREKDYSFDYSQQPSKAMLKYRKAFIRNDGARYQDFLRQVSCGKATLNTDTVMPYELVAPYLDWAAFTPENHCFMRAISDDEKASLNAAWASLPNFAAEGNALAIIDTSGSMYSGSQPLPAAVALSLGLYFAEHNTGKFKNHFIEFSDTPELIAIKGDTFVDRLRYIASFNEIASTDLEAVFDLILRTAVRNHVPQDDLPSQLYIISDMEFNCCVCNANATIFENAKAEFSHYGYRLPEVVFWNVNCRTPQQPVRFNEEGVALISGCSPRVFSMLNTKIPTPYAFMMDVLGSERYSAIVA